MEVLGGGIVSPEWKPPMNAKKEAHSRVLAVVESLGRESLLLVVSPRPLR